MAATVVIDREEVGKRVRALFDDSPGGRAIEIGIYEFDLGFVVWPVEPELVDWSRPPATIGGSLLVLDRRTGAPSLWPRLSGPQVARLYREARRDRDDPG